MRTLYNYIKLVAVRFDNRFNTHTKESGGRIYRIILRWLSPLRRHLDPFRIRLQHKFGYVKPGPIRLHLGCGWKHFEGYINIDLWINDSTDIICDISQLPWPNNSVETIENYHVIEHISHTKVKDALLEWHRVLEPGGRLIIECPNFDEAVKEYLSGDEARLINIFGRQRSYGDAHLYGYNPQRLERILVEVGFCEIYEHQPRSNQRLDEPSFRIECRKC